MTSSTASLRPKQSLADYILVLSILHQNQQIGRYKLAQQLQLSEARIRTILNKLVNESLVESSSQRHGHRLSQNGTDFWMQCQKFLRVPEKRIYLGTNYTVGTKDAIVCVEGTGIEKLNTVILRDTALMNGAMGCTVFFRESTGDIFLLNVIFPPLPSNPLSDRKILRKLNRVLSDIQWIKVLIIVGTANRVIDAKIGAIAASLLLLPENIRSKFKKFA